MEVVRLLLAVIQLAANISLVIALVLAVVLYVAIKKALGG